jgi:hypothetical protein
MKSSRSCGNLHRTRDGCCRGVNLEMPKSETHSIPLGGCVRCAICGNENAETNYYCGMCGAALTGSNQRPVQPAAPAPAAPRQAPPAMPPAQRQTAPPLRTEVPGSVRASADSQREQNSAPVITGPSFLGLNAPAPRSGPRDSARDNSLSLSSQGQDHLQHSSGNLDYLLDDEEEPKGGWGKLIVVLVALVLALGFGYLRWRQGGFDWLTGNKNPSAVAPATPAPQGSSGDSTSTPAPSTPNAASGAAAAPAATTPGQASSAPGVDSTPATAPGSGGPAATPAESAAPQTNPPQTQTSPAQTSSTQSGSSDSNPSDSNPGADSASPSSTQPSDSDSGTQPSQAQASTVVKPRQPKPTPAKPLDAVTEAERYIYGRGARQDCDHGLRLLKSAADQSNPKAMISLGALYTTGTCTPRDLPTAYRWFALALHKEPDNQALQDDLQKLWSQMTPPERQLAIKLSQ